MSPWKGVKTSSPDADIGNMGEPPGIPPERSVVRRWGRLGAILVGLVVVAGLISAPTLARRHREGQDRDAEASIVDSYFDAMELGCSRTGYNYLHDLQPALGPKYQRDCSSTASI